MEVYPSITIGKKVKRVGLQRFLLSKIAFEKDKVENRDILALFDNQIWLERKCLTDLRFSEKFETTLEVVSDILRDLNVGQGLSQKSLSRMSSKVKGSLSDFLFPLRNFAQMKSKFSGTYSLTLQYATGIPTKRLPPKAYIGKGYGDKGTAKKPEIDASPSWQAVATAVSNRERQEADGLEEIKNAKTFKELERGFWKVIRAGES